MKTNFEMDKKTLILIAGMVAAGLVIFLVIGPLFGKACKAAEELKALDSELADVREALEKGKTIDRKGHLLTRAEVSRAIDEITKVGASLNIDFLLTSPQPIQRPQGRKNPVLPIRMEIQSKYKDLGFFLGSLENLKESVLTVREFSIVRKEKILPKVYTYLVVEIYLEEGEGE